MLNINAFFEFKQRTRHSYSFQLAQLISHAEHVSDYYSEAQQMGPEMARRTSLPQADDTVRRKFLSIITKITRFSLLKSQI